MAPTTPFRRSTGGYQGKVSRIYFRADPAFAMPGEVAVRKAPGAQFEVSIDDIKAFAIEAAERLNASIRTAPLW